MNGFIISFSKTRRFNRIRFTTAATTCLFYPWIGYLLLHCFVFKRVKEMVLEDFPDLIEVLWYFEWRSFENRLQAFHLLVEQR